MIETGLACFGLSRLVKNSHWIFDSLQDSKIFETLWLTGTGFKILWTKIKSMVFIVCVVVLIGPALSLEGLTCIWVWSCTLAFKL